MIYVRKIDALCLPQFARAKWCTAADHLRGAHWSAWLTIVERTSSAHLSTSRGSSAPKLCGRRARGFCFNNFRSVWVCARGFWCGVCAWWALFLSAKSMPMCPSCCRFISFLSINVASCAEVGILREAWRVCVSVCWKLFTKTRYSNVCCLLNFDQHLDRFYAWGNGNSRWLNGAFVLWTNQ